MPRGGFRVGAGRKPGSKRAVLLGMDGSRLAQAPSPGGASELGAQVQPPRGLSAGQRRFWREWAPLAIGQRTLTTASVPGFAEACELAMLKQAVEKKIRRLGPATEASDGLLRTYVKLSQRLDAALARFKLTAYGKPLEQALPEAQPAANPWAQVAGR